MTPGRLSRRRLAAAAVLVTVVMVHLWLTDRWVALRPLGDAGAPGAPVRIEVAFVTELREASPPAPVARAPIVKPSAGEPRMAPSPAQAASAPLAAASEPVPLSPAPPGLAQDAPPAPRPVAEVVVEGAATSAGAVPAALPPSEPPPQAAPGVAKAFEWPPSTRLSYTLTGDFRGPVQGRARVEWLRTGERYQVHLEVRVGGDLVPLMSRRMSSDGRITAAGLEPARYDEETKVLLREPRTQTIVFEPGRVITPRGGPQPSLPGIQDTASQFVQLTWLFATQPGRLQKGQTLEMPLALARRVDRWVYDVVDEELVETPVGRIAAWYVRPRPESKTSSDLAVETWFAPSLQFLPVRIRIRQDDASFIDLLLERLPQQEASTPRAPGVGGASSLPR